MFEGLQIYRAQENENQKSCQKQQQQKYNATRNGKELRKSNVSGAFSMDQVTTP